MSPKTDYSNRYRATIPWTRLLPTIAFASLTILTLDLVLASRPATASKQPPTAQPAASPDTNSLGLRVSWNGQQVRILWDHNATAIRLAEKGSIRISDGDISEFVPFDRSQLQDGALVYTARTNDLDLKMDVSEPDGRQISESLRAVATP